MGYKVFTLSERKLWKHYLNGFHKKLQDVYFLPEYYELYERDVVQPQCFVYEKEENIIMYPYLKTHISDVVFFPCDSKYYDIEGVYGYNGIITNTNDKNFLNEFAAEFMQFCDKENIIAEFTRFNPVLSNHRFSIYLNVEVLNKNILVDLTLSEEDIWMESYEHCVRKNIKKAKNNKLSVCVYKGSELPDVRLDEFLEIYYATIDRNNAEQFYYFDRHYFKKISRMLGNETFFFFALLQDRPISCELVLLNTTTAYSFLGGTLSDYFSLRPNNLLKHEIIIKLKQLGLNIYCMGGGSKVDDGIYNYKKSFSKNGIVDFYVGKKIHNKKAYEEICFAWEEYFPQKKDKYINIFLKYKL